ncbi:MAG: 2-oxoacid:acceptor oxidoreductase family protein [Elusimicrobiota bacterium]|jgi:2-oxoglutarate ferredoxin oxidoreductase subunit gamma|nr:2-oxoacid:acceptor oxidoreductase family protein [Elusimicrobiota bacterium]
MQNEIIISGFGGQGVILAGALIAQGALEQGLYTTCFPAYGAEMRGGAANTTVIVSKEEIGSPVSAHPNILISLNEPSFEKFMPKIADDAIVIANSSMIPKDGKHKVKPYFIPLTDIADKEIKNIKTANFIAVGALIKILKNITLENIFKACEKAFQKKPNLIDANKKALQTGYDLISKIVLGGDDA